MTRETAIAAAAEHLASGRFRADLARRIAIPTESQNPERRETLERYLADEMVLELEALGFSCRIIDERGWPFLVAQ